MFPFSRKQNREDPRLGEMRAQIARQKEQIILLQAAGAVKALEQARDAIQEAITIARRDG